jgi:hypothetical protein
VEAAFEEGAYDRRGDAAAAEKGAKNRLSDDAAGFEA